MIEPNVALIEPNVALIEPNVALLEPKKENEAKGNILESLVNEVNKTPVSNLNTNLSTSIATSDVTNIPTAQNMPPKYEIPIN